MIRECPVNKRDDKNHLSLLIDIFKAHQKAIKHLVHKENSFASLLVDGYKVYVEGKLERLPDNVVVLDAAIKLCQCEIVLRKNQGKPCTEANGESSFLNSLKMFPSLTHQTSIPVTSTVSSVTKVAEAATSMTTYTSTSSFTSFTATASTSTAFSNLPQNLSSRPRGRPPGSKNALSKNADWNPPKVNPAAMAAMLGIYSNPSMPPQYTNPAQVTALLEEYYKLSTSVSSSLLNAANSVPKNFSSPPKSSNSSSTNMFPMKSSVASSTSVAPKPTSTVISVGSGQLTITPSCYTASNPPKNPKNPLSRRSETPMMNIGDGADFDIESMIPKSELLTNKIFPGMPGTTQTKSTMKPPINSNMSIPKDLPKSLTITPAPAGYSGRPIANNPPQITLQPEVKKKDKVHKRASTVPYMYGDVLAGYQQLLLSQMNSMSRNVAPTSVHQSQFLEFASKPKTQASNRKEQTSVKTLPYSMGSSSMYSDAHMSTLSSSSSRKYPPTTFMTSQSTNITQQAHSHMTQQAHHLIDSSPRKYATNPVVAHSPDKSPVLPPPTVRQPSPMQQAG